MPINKILAGISASVISLNFMLCPPQSEAASREEIAAINVVKASDFKYWNDDSSTRKKIVRFVEEATNPASKNFIPPANRIATFDMDGTFYCETAPLYFQEVMFLHRALEDKKYSPDRKMAAFAKKIKPKILNKTGLKASENKKLFEYLTKAYAGMTLAEFDAYVKKYAATQANGFKGMTYAESFYKPMLEVFDYLRDNGFTFYVVSGSDRFLCRSLVESLGISANRVIGMDVCLSSNKQGDKAGVDYTMGKEEYLVRTDSLIIKNLKTNKVRQISQEIGKMPVLSFGNSSGDEAMHNYCLSNMKYRTATFMLVADDDVHDHADLAEGARREAKWRQNGYTVISMKNDFKTIYGYAVEKTNFIFN